MSIRALFDHAVEIESSADREAYLAQACASIPGSREEVEALLKAHRDAGSFMESPLAAGEPEARERPLDGQFTWPSYPQKITVRSSLSGSATKRVARKW